MILGVDKPFVVCYNNYTATVKERDFDMAKVKNTDNIPMGSCVCSVCGVRKDNLEFGFYLNRKTKDGYRLRTNTCCASCSKEKGKEIRDAKKVAKAMGRPRPKIGDLCDCCKRPVYKKRDDIPDGIEGRWSWQCDHDHETGKFRGWICKTCNTGVCSDTISAAENALNYLRNTKDDNNRT